MPDLYHKHLAFRPNPAVAREITRLDARRDCLRIAQLLSGYEFSWDFQRALELALFYTYGSARVSLLLDRTGEFRRAGQKRYDDTRLLLAHLLESGWEGEVGRRALARINSTHSHYRIPNDDFLFVLWTFIEFPIRWTSRHARRAMTPHEQEAWFHFWVGLGEQMGITGIPADKPAFDRWIGDYKEEWFLPSDASARVADATLGILQGWLPPVLRGMAGPVVYSFFADDPAFLTAIKVKRPPALLRRLVDTTLRGMARLQQEVVIGPYPLLPNSPRNRTYGRTPYRIEALRPDRFPEE